MSGIDRGIEIVTSLDGVRDRLVLAAMQSREQIRGILKFVSVSGNRDSRRRDPDQYRRGLIQRTIVDTNDLADPEFFASLEDNSRDGDQIRSMIDAPTQLYIYDDALADLPLDIGHPRLGAMFIREQTLIHTLVHMFEHYWREATPVYVQVGGPASPRQTRVLELLASGATDDAIARSLAVGTRTIRREVACLRDLLGVNSRTEIVAAAMRRGWL